MELRIADTFTESLAKLTREEQKSVKTTALDLYIETFDYRSNAGLEID